MTVEIVAGKGVVYFTFKADVSYIEAQEVETT